MSARELKLRTVSTVVNFRSLNDTERSTITAAKSTTLPYQHNITRYITGVRLRHGRLGNQLFQYASLLGIAQSQGMKLIAGAGTELEKTFKLHHVRRNEIVNDWQEVEETNSLAFDTKLMNMSYRNISIRGFLQSFKYFISISDYIRYEYTFQDSIESAAATIYSNINSKRVGSLFVGVQVRRGDYRKKFNQKLGYIIPDRTYYINAFAYMRSTFPGRNITFLIASDDTAWCNATLNLANVIILQPVSAAIHLAVLAKCEHIIISSGTYSWWSGWLSAGYVIYFNGYMPKNTTFGDTFVPEDYYPSHWIGLGN